MAAQFVGWFCVGRSPGEAWGRFITPRMADQRSKDSWTDGPTRKELEGAFKTAYEKRTSLRGLGPHRRAFGGENSDILGSGQVFKGKFPGTIREFAGPRCAKATAQGILRDAAMRWLRDRPLQTRNSDALIPELPPPPPQRTAREGAGGERGKPFIRSFPKVGATPNVKLAGRFERHGRISNGFEKWFWRKTVMNAIVNSYWLVRVGRGPSGGGQFRRWPHREYDVLSADQRHGQITTLCKCSGTRIQRAGSRASRGRVGAGLDRSNGLFLSSFSGEAKLERHRLQRCFPGRAAPSFVPAWKIFGRAQAEKAADLPRVNGPEDFPPGAPCMGLRLLTEGEGGAARDLLRALRAKGSS